MTRRAQRPLDSAAARKANDTFYAAHPEMIEDGKRIPISTNPSDPCAALMREEWMDSYVSNGGKVDTATFPTSKVGCATVPCPLTKRTLTEKEANSLFRELAANKNIPFDYPVDCCYSRAHSMCRTIESKGIGCEKVWYFDKDWGSATTTPSLHPRKADGSAVTFPDSTGVKRPVQWVYHVAPLVKVVRADGTTQDMVMDPSLADRPLTKDEWKKIQGNPAGAYEEVTDNTPYFSNKTKGYRIEDPDMKETCVQLEKHKRDRNAGRRAAVKRP